MGSSRTASAPDAEIARIAFRQHGVVTLQQLRDAGLGAGAIDLRVRQGRLHRLHRGVYAVGHARISQEGRWLAAVLALGEGAVLSHVSAAAIWGIRHSRSAYVHVNVPAAGGRRRRRAIVVHRCAGLGPTDVDEHRAIALTSVSRTDGREDHGTPTAFHRDRERDERLTVLGCRVVRFSPRRVVRHPEAVAATLRALLADAQSASRSTSMPDEAARAVSS